MSDARWYFSKEQLENSPSRRLAIDADKELNYKQQAANLIYDMASRKQLSLNQLCISTAIVYMQRFYVFHSFSHFKWNSIAMASLFLAAKVEEQTRKLEHIIKTALWCLQKNQAYVNYGSESYFDQVQELVMNENILLQTLGFDLNVNHPHTFVVEFCEKIKLGKEITKTMYGMASNSLNVTTMCVRYKPSVVACFCIHFICNRWKDRVKMMNDESRPWWTDIDQSVTQELLDQMVGEFCDAYVKAPLRLKNKIHELLDCRNITIHRIDREFDTNGRSWSDLFCYSTASTSSSFPSKAMIQFHNQGKASPDAPSTSGSTRVHKSSTTSLSNHLRTPHSSLNTSTSPALINSSIETTSNLKIAPSFSKSNPATHLTSSQYYHRHSQHQQHHYNRQQFFETISNSKHAHKICSSSTIHRPRIAAIGHLTSSSDNNGVLTKLDRRRTDEIVQNSGSLVKHEPDYRSSKFADSRAGAIFKDSNLKVDNKIQDCYQLLTNSHSDRAPESSSNQVNQYAATSIVDGIACDVEISTSSQTHSINSLSMVHRESSFPVELLIKQAPSTADAQIKQNSSVNELFKLKNQQDPADVHFSDLCMAEIRVETVPDYGNMFENIITVPSSGNASEPSICTPIISNVVSLAQLSNEQLFKQRTREIKSEPCVNSQPCLIGKPPLVSKPIEERAVSSKKIDIVAVGECSSESHKENKKEKKHKEKKRHKEDKRRHHHHRHHHHHQRKEHHSVEKERKPPGPILISIPIEKLTHVPPTPKPKMNRSQIVASSTSDKIANNDNGLKNKSKDESKSRKRKRESDLDHSSNILSINPPNGFRD